MTITRPSDPRVILLVNYIRRHIFVFTIGSGLPFFESRLVFFYTMVIVCIRSWEYANCVYVRRMMHTTVVSVYLFSRNDIPSGVTGPKDPYRRQQLKWPTEWSPSRRIEMSCRRPAVHICKLHRITRQLCYLFSCQNESNENVPTSKGLRSIERILSLLRLFLVRLLIFNSRPTPHAPRPITHMP